MKNEAGQKYLGQKSADVVLASIVTSSIALALVAYSHGLFLEKWNILLAMVVPFALAPVLAILSPSTEPDAAKSSKIVEIAAFLSSCACMITLQNWQEVQAHFVMQPTTTAIAIAAVWLGVSRSVATLDFCDAPSSSSARYAAIFSILPWIFFYLFSRRTDSLFAEWSAPHWEYFVGPIRTLRNGGLLLWDAPAQYGYLTTLLPSLLPFRSVWTSFYYFQVFVLFACAGLFYMTLTRRIGLSRLFSSFVVIATFFLSYPPLIGPAPYPSSSGVRFMWCFAFLALAAEIFLSKSPSLKRWLVLGGLMWVVALFWSSESGAYATVIFWAPICLHFLLSIAARGSQGHVRAIWFAVPAGMPLVAYVLWAIGTYWLTGEWPDLSMHFLYSIGYSSGFGSLPIPPFGALWLYVILLITGAIGLRAALSMQLTACGPAGAIIAAMGCIFAISTYYIGRAVPNNVIAQYGLLVLCALVILKGVNICRITTPALRAVVQPIIVLGLVCPLWNPALLPVVMATFARQQDVLLKIPTADDELIGLLGLAGINAETPVNYYGDLCFMPAVENAQNQSISFEKTWLPSPMQLLEQPVDPAKREQIIARYQHRHTAGGYIVKAAGQADGRFAEWLALLQKFYKLDGQWQTENYQVYKFGPRLSS